MSLIESGDNDSAVGGVGEVSRFQIKPAIWRQYTQSEDYNNSQIAALVAMAWLLGLVREDAKDIGPFTRVSNAGLMAAGAFLFLTQMHGYAHTSNPHDFGFNRDDHVHHHEEMERFAREALETLMRRD